MFKPIASLLCAVLLALANFSAAADPVFIDHGPRGTPEQAQLQMGTLFGSIAFAPATNNVSALSLHLIPLEGGRHKLEIFATNRMTHPNWRTPDVDTPDERVWAFAGDVPEGHYLLRLAGVSAADARDVEWIEFSPALEMVVKPGAALYIGRWQFTRPDIDVPEPRVRMPGQPMVLRDTLPADKALLQKRGRELPAEVDDAPKAMFGARV